MAKTFQKKVVTNQLTLATSISITVAIWAVCYILHPVASTLETIGAYIIYATIGYFLIVLNKSFAIIRLRASFQTVIFMILTAICPQIHLIYNGNLMTLCFLGCTFLIFHSYQMERSAGILFHAFILLGISYLLVPKIIWLIPYFWYCCYALKSLNLKSFIASIFGWSIPVGSYAVYDYMNNEGVGFIAKQAEVVDFGQLQYYDIELPIVVTLLLAFIIHMISTCHTIKNNMDDKVQTRSYLQQLIISILLLFILAFIDLSITWQLMPLMLMEISLLYGHFVTLSNNKWSNIIFISIIIAMVPVFIINLRY